MKIHALRACVVAVVLASANVAVAQVDGRWGAVLAEGFQKLNAANLTEASAIFDRVAREALAGADEASWAEARRGQGRVMAARGDTGGMRAAYAEAMKAFEAAGDLKGIGNIHSDLAYAAWLRRDYELVRAEYAAAANAFEKGGFKSNQASALRNMTFGRMDMVEERATLERALALVRETGEAKTEGLILHALGDLHSGDLDQQRALERYEAALPLLETANDPAALARLLTSFGRLHRIHGDPERAIAYYERTLALLQKTADRDAIRQAEDALSISLAAVQRDTDALAHAERALAIAEQVRPGFVPAQRIRVGEMALRARDYDRALQLFGAEPVGDNPLVAVRRQIGRAHVFYARSEFVEAFKEADAAVTAALPMNWELSVSALNVRGYIHEREGRLEEAADDAVAAVGVVENVRGGLVMSDDFRAAFSDGYRSVYDRAVSMLMMVGRQQDAFDISEKARARALLDLRVSRTPNETPPAASAPAASFEGTVLAYWVTRNATYAWAIDGGRVKASARVPIARDELQRLIGKANGARSPGPVSATARRGQTQAVFEDDPRPTLKQLHERIFAPLRNLLPKTEGARVLILPDGPLLGLSFSELMSAGGRYLVEDYTLQYAPSLALSKRAGAAIGNGAAGALLVSLSTGFPKSGLDTLAPLPGARREVDALARLFPATTTSRMNDAEATEARVRSAMTESRVIHLATHAIASSRAPSESFLALRPGNGHDGRLTAGELIGMSIRAELVVLSACHGASGQVTGEGMLGLSRALLAAGAHTLLASVRELPDEAAADMLPRFYTAWKTSGDAARALRSAQLEQLQRLRAGRVQIKTAFGEVTVPEHPSMWAGLVLIGQR